MLAATTMIQELSKCGLRRRIRLFEGFAPLSGADHAEVVDMLRQVVRNPDLGAIIPPGEIISARDGTLRPIFGVSDREPRIPPVVSVFPA